MKLVYCTRGFLFLSILTTAVVASGQARYSLNVVGYVDARFYSGSNLMANPLTAGNNSISNLLAGLPSGSFYLPWNQQLHEFGPANLYTTENGWTDPEATILRRDAGFLWLPEARTVSFVGEPWPATFCIQYPPGMSVSGVLPKYACVFCANITDCLITPEVQITQWDRVNQTFVFAEYILDFGWMPTEPTLAPGEAAVIYFGGPSTLQARSLGPLPSIISEVPLLNPRLSGTNFYFEFPSFNGVSYTVQRSENLSNGPWETILTATTTSSGAFTPVEVPRTGKAAFYRLYALRLLNPVRSGASFQFQFYAESGTQYQVKRSPSLEQAVWQTIGSVEGQGKLVTFNDSSANAAAAYYSVGY